MRILIATTALILSACGATPNQVREEGAQHDYALAGKILDAERCIVRNAEGRSSMTLANARDAENGMREIIVRRVGDTPEAMAVVMLQTQGGKTVAIMKVNTSLMFTSTDEYGRRLVDGC